MSRHEHLFELSRDFCSNGYPAVGSALRDAIIALKEAEIVESRPSSEWQRRLKGAAKDTVSAVQNKTARIALSFDLVDHYSAQRAISNFAMSVEFLSEFDVTLTEMAKAALNELKNGHRQSRKTNKIMTMRANIREAMSYIDDAAVNSRLNAALLPA